MGWQFIVLLAGSLFSLFSLVLSIEDSPNSSANEKASNNKRDKVKTWIKWISTILIVIGVGAAGVDIFNKESAEKKNADNLAATLQKSDSTLTQINRATHILDSVQGNSVMTIDSLKDVQQKTKKITDSLSKQLNLLHRLSLKTEFLTSKNAQLLDRQENLIATSKRIENPLFPLLIELEGEMPTIGTQHMVIRDYFLSLKKTLEAPLEKPVPEIAYLTRDSSNRIKNVTVFFDKTENYPMSGLTLWDMRVSFIESSKKAVSSLHDLKRDPRMTFFIDFKQTKYLITADYEKQTYYFDIFFKIDTPVYLSSRYFKNFGYDDLKNCFVVFDPNPWYWIQTYQVTKLRLLSLANPKNIILLRGKPGEMIKGQQSDYMSEGVNEAPKDYYRFVHRITPQEFEP